MKKSERLDRETWLKEALEVLRTQGSTKLHIAELSRDLGVSKGSFYWHFTDRADFIRATVKYWEDNFTRRVMEGAEAKGGTAYDRLLFVLRMVTEEDLSRYDPIFDSWAAHEPDIQELVRDVHRFRHDYVKSLFKELGFDGTELTLRTQGFLGFLKYRAAKGLHFKTAESAGDLAQQLAFFTRN